MRWDEQSRTLTIGKRHGEFAGMLKNRTFQIVFVRPERAVAFTFDPKADQTVQYDGQAVSVRLNGK
jgi:alpha-D-xyloside xylohydrolase